MLSLWKEKKNFILINTSVSAKIIIVILRLFFQRWLVQWPIFLNAHVIQTSQRHYTQWPRKVYRGVTDNTFVGASSLHTKVGPFFNNCWSLTPLYTLLDSLCFRSGSHGCHQWSFWFPGLPKWGNIGGGGGLVFTQLLRHNLPFHLVPQLPLPELMLDQAANVGLNTNERLYLRIGWTPVRHTSPLLIYASLEIKTIIIFGLCILSVPSLTMTYFAFN